MTDFHEQNPHPTETLEWFKHETIRLQAWVDTMKSKLPTYENRRKSLARQVKQTIKEAEALIKSYSATIRKMEQQDG